MVSNASGIKFGRLELRPGHPLDFSDLGAPVAPEDADGIDGEYRSRVARTLKAYLTATRDLLDGRFKHLRELAPIHMTSACLPVAFIFSDGVIIRYDRKDNSELMVASAIPVDISKQDGTPIELSLTGAVPFLSEQFLHCVAEPNGYDPGADTPMITISVGSHDTGQETDIAKHRIFAVTAIPPKHSDDLPKAVRPLPTISIRNEFDLLMNIATESEPTKPSRKFLMRSRFRIPAGWEALEIFPRYPAEVWTPDTAALWAENDLLAAVLQRNLREDKFKALDPMSEARKKMAKLIVGCEELLNGPEEPLHQYIKTNPELLSPTHYRYWSKLPLGKRYTDFVFRQPSGEYLLVEIESPLQQLFRADGQQREELTHAVDQVMDWRRYLEDNLRTAQAELGLDGISSNPSCLIVIGRSSSLTDHGRRKLQTLHNSMPWLKIMTYDDLIATARATAENILGPLWDPGPTAEVYLVS